MGTYVDDKSNMTDSGINVESPVSCNNWLDNHIEGVDNVEVEMNESTELMAEGITEEEKMLDGNTGNCSNEEYSEEDGGFGKGKQVTVEPDLEQEDTNRSNKENINKTRKSKKSQQIKIKPKKKTKKEIRKERMKIRSETHRLMREREITIPYHVPRQRTLKEFLERKKFRTDIPINLPAFQMVELWKEIEESTKSAFEFFKSESESDEESCNNNNEKHHKSKKKYQEHEKSRRKSCDNSDKSNCNVVVNNCSTVVSSDNDNGKLNSDLTNGKLYSEPNNDDNAVFMCEGAQSDSNDLINRNGKCLTKQDVEGSIGCTNDDSSNLVVDLTRAQSENSVDNNTEGQDEKYAMQRTADWVKDIPAYEKHLKQNKKEMLLQKLDPKLLTITPKLSGEPDSFIDLESGQNSIEIGAKNLKKRFLENCLGARYKPKTEFEMTITTSEKNEKGEISNIGTEKLIYTSPEVLNDPDLNKPGAKLQRFREELWKKIEEKWDVEFEKQLEQERIEEENRKLQEKIDNEEFEEEEEEEEAEFTDSETEKSEDGEESEPEEDDVILVDKKKKRNRFIDSEAEESVCEEVEESGNEGGDEIDDGETKDDDSCDAPEEQTDSLDKDVFPVNEYSDSQSSLIPPYQPGGGMLNGGSTLTQNDEGISLPKDILSPSLQLSLDLSPSAKNESQQPWDIDLESPEESNTKSNFVPCFPESKNFDLNDAYEFCSGKFPGEGGESRDVRYDETNSQGFVSNRDSQSQIDSNAFDSLIVKEGDGERESEKKKRSRLKVESDVSDDEMDRELDDLDDLEDITKRRVSSEDSDVASEKSLPVKNRRAKKNLVFSDDEDNEEMGRNESEKEDEEDEEDSSQKEDEEEDPFADEGDREVQYDSEEGEIVNPREYFDKEAELSGSEWSGDEDEKGLDEYEEEDGDDDKLDERKVRSQLEKIHVRTLLDDDERNVRLLKEILFEDGDLYDGTDQKPERVFKWKDLGTFFDDDEKGQSDEENSQGQDDFEEDEESRKIRHEKELFLLQMKSKREEEGVDDECGPSLLKRGKVIIESSLSGPAAKKKSPTVRTEVDDIGFKTPFALTNKRGSFLSRNEEFLSRLAKFTSNATDNILGPKHSKNFVFAAKSPEKEGSSSKENSHPKRKNPSPKDEPMRNKKPKLDKATTSSKTSILDRLT